MTEFYNQRMYEIFDAILLLEKKEKFPVSSRIVEITGQKISRVARNLSYYYDWGYVSKTAANGRRERRVAGCIWYYTLTKRGLNKYMELRVEFERPIDT